MTPSIPLQYAWRVETAGFLLLLGLGLIFYFLPSMIASTRRVQHSGGILAVNLFFGWTVLGWIAALIWALVEERETPVAPVATGRRQTWFGYSEPRNPESPESIPGVAASKKCPKCAEMVKKDAVICRFCRYEFMAD